MTAVWERGWRGQTVLYVSENIISNDMNCFHTARHSYATYRCVRHVGGGVGGWEWV